MHISPNLDHPSYIQTSSHPKTTSIIKLDMFFGVLAKLRKATISLVMSVCPSVLWQRTVRFPQYGFSWKVISIFPNLTFVCPRIASKIANDDQQDATILVFYLFLISSTCFGRPSSGALDCIYSFWYCPPILLPAGVMDAIPSHPWHQQAAISVDNIRSCKYSQALLTMGARNM